MAPAEPAAAVKLVCIALSFNGRTSDSDSLDRGSNPWGATKTRAGDTSLHFPEPPQTRGGSYVSTTYENIESEEVRDGATTAGVFCGGYCGVRSAKVWGLRNSPLWRAHHGTDHQGTRKR